MSFEVSASPLFRKNVKRLSKKYPSLKGELGALFASLAELPEQGTLIAEN